MLAKPGKIIPIILVVTLLAVSVASVVAAPVSQGDTVEVTCVEDYEVQDDDWLSKIAVEFYGDPLLYTAIFEATNAAVAAGGDYASLANPDAIEIGQVLCIPSLEVAQALVAGGQAVMVAAGEAAGPAEEEAAVPETAAAVISSDARLGTLGQALALTGLEETLTAPDAGPFTLFAPTDAAFDNLPGGGLAWLQANPDRLAQVLQYHLVPVSLTGDSLEAMTQVDTLLGQPLEVTTSNGTLSVGGASLDEMNLVQTARGPIYVIDTVLLPPDIRADLVAAGEEEVAAAEEAAAEAEEEMAAGAEEAAVEAEEAVAGAEEAVAEAEETAAEAEEPAAEAEEAAGGLADELLSDLAQAGAPVEEGAGAEAMAEAEEAAVPETAAAVISSDARLGTLGQALALTGLEETLTAPDAGPFTLFAPTDAAFDNLPGGGLAWLQANPDRLAQVLQYHLVPVSLTGDSLEAMTQVDTLLGQPLEVTTSNGTLSVGGASLDEMNLVQTARGPIYVIDTVLLPPDIRADLVAAGEEEVAAAEEAAGATEERAGGLVDELLSDLDQAGAPVEEGAGAEAMAEAEETAAEAEEAAAEAEEAASGLADELLSDLAQAGAPVEEGAGAEAMAEAEETAAGAEAEAAEGEPAPEAQAPAGAEAEGAAGEPAGSRVVIFNFAQALTAATQSGRLQLNAPVTIFAPTSNAFALLPQAELANLAADPVRLQNLLLNHLVSGAVWSTDLAGTPTLNSLIGQPLDTSIEDGKYMIEDAQVLAADFRFGNVVIHLIDKVLLPEETP